MDFRSHVICCLLKRSQFFFPGDSSVLRSFDLSSGQIVWQFNQHGQQASSVDTPQPTLDTNLVLLSFQTLNSNYAFGLLDARTGQVIWQNTVISLMYTNSTSDPTQNRRH